MKKSSVPVRTDLRADDVVVGVVEATRERRQFLKRSLGAAGAVAAVAAVPVRAADPIGKDFPAWSTTPGTPMRSYGQPSKFEEKVLRTVTPSYGPISPGTGTSRTPLQTLNGTITPNGLHFERHHNGVPEIDPAQHKLLIHGMVKKPLVFTVANLLRYPMVSRTCFVECAGNSSANTLPKPAQANCAAIHGLLSGSEWTGVSLSLLLDEAGVEPGAKWFLAEGADSAAMSRSVLLEKAYDDAIIALYQNGERIRPEQGYPLRLLVPGYQGNMNVKWLRRLELAASPMHTKDETSKYSLLLRDGTARQFDFQLGVKSLITQPSGTLNVPGKGLHEISGLAWSGAGRIVKVEVSSDGGANWREAVLQGPVLSKALTRFRLPWEWSGAPAMLQSRATDEKGHVQPTRAAWSAIYSPANRYHNNMIQTWAVAADGSVSNVYL